MLLTITTTHQPATDLGYLLHKHPDRVQSFELTVGSAHVFYPEAGPERCTAALLLDVDPVGLVRGRAGQPGAQYVGDRPYAASSLLSVAIARVFGTALAGRCQSRQALADSSLPLEVTVAALPCSDGPDLVERLFAPLGYQVSARVHPLDEAVPEWGPSPYLTVTLAATCRLQDVLQHLYVLIPVLDGQKHYWIDEAEVDKLLRHGASWLAAHPEREVIARRYLKHQRNLTEVALARLTAAAVGTVDAEAEADAPVVPEVALEERVGLHEQRLAAVLAELKACGARRVLDLGCGEGKLLQRLLADGGFDAITGLDVSYRALERARERLHLERLAPAHRERVQLLHGALTYRDARLAGYDAAAAVEVIEHLDPDRLAAFARVVFEAARPQTVIVTTPNAEYNPLFPTLPTGARRHPDHRFEWTRQEFQGWATAVAGRYGYAVRFAPIGPADPAVGAPSQMGVFTR